jgi:hypothetical protein
METQEVFKKSPTEIFPKVEKLADNGTKYKDNTDRIRPSEFTGGH